VSRSLVLSFVMALALHALVARVELDMGKGHVAARKVPRRLTMALVKPRPVKKVPDTTREKIALSNTDKVYPVTTGPRQGLDSMLRVAQERDEHRDAPREPRARIYTLVTNKESPARIEDLGPRPAHQDEESTVVPETMEHSAPLVKGKGVSRSTEEGKRPEEPLVLAAPDYQKNAPPPYPLLARKRNYQGTVLLEVLVKADGTVGSIRLSRSSGYETLDRAAITGVRKWMFQPATKGHEAIDMWVEIPIRFELK
jgi:TonB family protein